MRLRDMGTALEWSADSIGACVLIGCVIFAFFVLGVMTNKPDSAPRHATTSTERQ